jgi:hypothetical protein
MVPLPDLFQSITVIAVVFAGTDLYFVFASLRSSQRLGRVNVTLVMLARFKQLLGFYQSGRASQFIGTLAQPSGATSITLSTFRDAYPDLAEELGKLFGEFELPKRLLELPRELRRLAMIAGFLTVADALVAYSSVVYTQYLALLVFVLVVNAVLMVPFVATLWEAVHRIAETDRVTAESAANAKGNE